jgi:flagellar motor switch protein FliG
LNALYGASEETKEAVLSVRPPREREMIKSELEAGNTISNDAKLKAKKKILEKVRKFV